MEFDYAFEMAAANIRFGPGAAAELGYDLAELKVGKVMVLTDPTLSGLPPVKTVLASLDSQGVAYDLYDQVRIEPTDSSLKEAIAFAQAGRFGGFVAVGGGSVIDTAKAANLYSTYPVDDFLTYVNAPVGKGVPIPGELKPLFAVPTTAGTGSETTGVVIFDFEEMHAKTGIAHRRLKPTLGVVDPLNTITMPPLVTASTGLDVLTHAVESYTAMPFNRRPKPDKPILRPAYQGSNPISDIWSLKAMEMISGAMFKAVDEPDNIQARGDMALAASFAGVGFGNAGVTIPHGMSYPVSGMVKDYQPAGYPTDHPLVPHGVAVVLNAPAAFRFTGQACPERHLTAAAALGADIKGVPEAEAGECLAATVIGFMKRLDLPNGLGDIGYTEADIPKLVEGTLPQHRVTKLSPRPVGPEELTEIFKGAMKYW